MTASALFLRRAGRFPARLALGAVLALTTILLLPAAAAQAASSPLDFSAGDQYVETLPTTKGPKVTENAPKRRAGSALPKSVHKQLAAEGGSDAQTLSELAGSPELGAPVVATGSSERSSRDGASRKNHKTKDRAAKGSPSVPSAAINATAGSGSGLGWLALGLPLITAVALGTFALQRRNRDAG
jgi:hypothetical protein